MLTQSGNRMKRKVPRLLKLLPVGALRVVLLMLLNWQIGLPTHAEAQPQVPPLDSARKILVLYTYGDGLPAYRKANAAFWPIITAGGVNSEDIFSEYLDLERNRGAEYRRRMADLLRYKYARKDFGLIVTFHEGALNFLLNEGKGLFPDVCVLSYSIVRPELIEANNPGRRIILKPQGLDMGGTLEIAMKMFPETRKVIFVVGTADEDRRIAHEAERVFGPWRDRLEFQFTGDRSLEEMLQLVGSLPPRSIVIYCNVFSDKTGRTFIPLEVGKMVVKAANAPVFCLWDTLLGSGPIGGSLLSFEAEGAYAANVALDILNGKILLTKPVTILPTSKVFMFDWRQLKRWDVSEAALQKGSIVVNRESTFWDFKYYIVGTLALGALQWVLIAGLLAQRRRRAKADEALKERLAFEGLLSALSAKLLKVAPHEVDREVERALKGIVDFFRVSHSILIKGFPEENKAVITHAAHADNVPPTPLGGNLYLPFPWTSKMLARGESLWVPTLDRLPAEAAADKEAYKNLGVRSFLIIPILTEGLPGYAIAISAHQEVGVWPSDYIPRLELLGEILVSTLERKQAEESLRKAEEKYRNIFEGALEGIYETSPEGQNLTASPALARMLGYESAEEVTAVIKDSAHQVWVNLEERARYARLLEEQNVVLDFETQFWRKDRTKIWVSINGRRVCGPDGQTLYFSGFIEDITERKRTEEAFQEI